MKIKCTVTVIVICNVIIVRANINILNREIESRFSDNPKKKRKNIETKQPRQILRIYDTFQANSSSSVIEFAAKGCRNFRISE